MKFFKTLVSTALTSAVIFGLSTPISAATESYNIDEYFPDPALNKFVRQYDTDRNGSFDRNELKNAGDEYSGALRYLWIRDPEIKSLDGMELFSDMYLLHLSDLSMSKIDLTAIPIKIVEISDCANLKTLVCGKKQETLNISKCSLDRTYFNYADNLNSMTIYKTTLKRDLDLENSPKMQYFYFLESKGKGVYFSDEAELKKASVCGWNTTLRSFSSIGTKLNTVQTLCISTNGTLNSLTLNAELVKFIVEHNYYYFNNNGTVNGSDDILIQVD